MDVQKTSERRRSTDNKHERTKIALLTTVLAGRWIDLEAKTLGVLTAFLLAAAARRENDMMSGYRVLPKLKCR